MKKIECIIRPEKLKEVERALRLAGVGGMTISEVKGFGRETTRPEAYLILPKTKIDIYAADGQVEEIIAAIISCCREDMMGSGKIAVLSMEECIRIRTGECGEKAIF